MSGKTAFLEKASWIAGIVGTLIAIVLFFKDCGVPSIGSSSSKNANFEQGKWFINNEQWDSAIFYFRKYVIECPSDPDGFCKLGISLYHTGNLQSAINNFSEALRIHKKETCALIGRSKCYILLKENLKAKRDLDEALEYEENDTEALNLRGEIYLAENDLHMAELLYQRGLQISPQDPKLNYNFALALTGQMIKFESAVEPFKKGSKQELDELYTKAIEALHSSMKYSEPNAEANFALGWILFFRYISSKESIHMVDGGGSFYLSGNMQFALEAKESFKTAIAIDSNYGEAYFYKGCIEFANKEKADAKYSFLAAKGKGIIPVFNELNNTRRFEYISLQGLSHSSLSSFSNLFRFCLKFEEDGLIYFIKDAFNYEKDTRIEGDFIPIFK